MIEMIFAFLFSISSHAHEGPRSSCEGALKPNPLSAAFTDAQKQLPVIESHFRSLTLDQQNLHKSTWLAIQAALTKHQEIFLREHNWKKLDSARHLAILNQIAQFNGKIPQFSLYKIKRAIEGRHSLNEYVNCHSAE